MSNNRLSRGRKDAANEEGRSAGFCSRKLRAFSSAHKRAMTRGQGHDPKSLAVGGGML